MEKEPRRNGEKTNPHGTIVNRQDAKGAKKVLVNTNCRNNHKEPRIPVE